MSRNHPPLDNTAPQTTEALKRRRASASLNSSVTPSTRTKKQRRLDITDLHNIIVRNDIRTDKQLCALAKVQMTEGKHDLQKYLLSHPNSKHRHVIATVWNIEEGELRANRRNKAPLEILEEVLTTDCAESQTGLECRGSWLTAAFQTLERNDIDPKFFAQQVKTALKHGCFCGKDRNIMLIGPTNCGKSFLLQPLVNLYDCFMCPAATSFNFVSAVDKEVLLFNDLRYGENGKGDKDFLPWQDLLNLLNGSKLNVAMPKKSFC